VVGPTLAVFGGMAVRFYEIFDFLNVSL